MDTIFKFCGKYGLDILRNLELKITPPNQFNDPFEFTPRNRCSNPVGCAKRDLERGPGLEMLHKMLISNGKFSGSFPEFQEVAKERKGEWIAILAKAPEHTLRPAEGDLLDRVSERLGVLCMSARRDSILMWGHYCDKPLGFVIGFDRSAIIFRQGIGLRPVVYDCKRVDFDYAWDRSSPEMSVFEDQILFTKGKEWSYEAELRQVYMLASSSLVRKPLKNNETILGYFQPFPAAAIVSVTYGPRSSPELENEVGSILAKPCLAHVKRDRAILHRDDFVLEFE